MSIKVEDTQSGSYTSDICYHDSCSYLTRIYIADKTMNFWSVYRGHDKKKCKYGGLALHTNKNFIRNWLFVYKLWFSRKKYGGWWYIYFLEKPLKFLDLLPYPWKFWTKQSFIAGNRAKLFDTSWEQSKIICDFSWLSLKMLHISCFTSRIPNASSSKLLKNPSPWIANFMTSLE